MYFKNLKLTIILTLFFFPAFNSNAGVMDNDEATAFASFIQDLVITSQTPKHGAICALGSDEISRVIASQDKDFIDLDVYPKKFLSCKAIYVAMSKQKGLGSDIIKFNKNKILTIATFDGFTEMGGMIQVEMGRRSFELSLNSKEVKAASVRLNALAMSLVIN